MTSEIGGTIGRTKQRMSQKEMGRPVLGRDLDTGLIYQMNNS
jgi:hypothetical protein